MLFEEICHPQTTKKGKKVVERNNKSQPGASEKKHDIFVVFF